MLSSLLITLSITASAPQLAKGPRASGDHRPGPPAGMLHLISGLLGCSDDDCALCIDSLCDEGLVTEIMTAMPLTNVDGAVSPANQISRVLSWREGQKLIWILNMGLTPGEVMHESSSSVQQSIN